MKKIILVILLASLPTFLCLAQGVKVLATTQSGEKLYYVGSLKPEGKMQHEKLKVEIFGGSYHESSIGIQTFTMSDRDQLKINSEIRNGRSNYYQLMVFKAANNNLDFVIKASPAYTVLWIQAWLSDAYTSSLGKPLKMVPVDIVEYNPEERGTIDVTGNYSINYLMISDDKGYIGIGTPTPQSRLDVRGKITASEVEIKLSSGADFVFKPGYNLMPLSEVESFVKENQHLPEIPSEKEMIDNGVNVNEMQIKLLQKIEELTLYVIEQEKQNKKLQEQIDMQNERISQLQNK